MGASPAAHRSRSAYCSAARPHPNPPPHTGEGVEARQEKAWRVNEKFKIHSYCRRYYLIFIYFICKNHIFLL
jgi:hypothetical protein